VLDGVVRSLRALPFVVGKELQVVAFSIDPEEGPAQAQKKKQATLRHYSGTDSAEGWHFLTGQKDAIEQLSRAIGFRYARRGARQEYVHASGIVVLTPGGRVARYFYGFDFAPRDLKLGLVEAGQGRIGSAIDQLLLLCYSYDPATGKYGPIIFNSLRLAGVATLTALGTFVIVMLRRERRNHDAEKDIA
jgi:protein SCO1/2